MQYQVFQVNERVFEATEIKGYFQGGIVCEGTMDGDNFLLVVRYDDVDYNPANAVLMSGHIDEITVLKGKQAHETN